MIALPGDLTLGIAICVPWGAVSTRPGIRAPLARMLMCSVPTPPVWIHWDTLSANIHLHLWSVCSDCSPSQIDAGVHLRGHGNIHGNVISWCICHPYNLINSAGTNILVCWCIQDSVACAVPLKQKSEQNRTFELTVISTLSLTMSHNSSTHPHLCGYS